MINRLLSKLKKIIRKRDNVGYIDYSEVIAQLTDEDCQSVFSSLEQLTEEDYHNMFKSCTYEETYKK